MFQPKALRFWKNTLILTLMFGDGDGMRAELDSVKQGGGENYPTPW